MRQQPQTASKKVGTKIGKLLERIFLHDIETDPRVGIPMGKRLDDRALHRKPASKEFITEFNGGVEVSQLYL